MSMDELYVFLDDDCYYLEESGELELLKAVYPVVMEKVFSLKDSWVEEKGKKLENFLKENTTPSVLPKELLDEIILENSNDQGRKLAI